MVCSISTIRPIICRNGWPDDDRSSCIVFIVAGLPRDLIERWLAAYRLGAPALVEA